ncbi:MAG: group III truncated hemoglobin [Chitinophagaceae bacterium]|nr:MAG: group III truncated hemoglobin [Chitinophagaceae bacterium]
MITKPDIATRADIDHFIRMFYKKVTADPVIGIIFTEIVQMDWDHHIPLIVDFWESILLDNPVYKRNAMAVHYDINKKYPLRPEHFQAWLSNFNEVMDALFVGPVANLAKKRAEGIALLMSHKMNS